MKKKGSICDYITSRNENLKREFFARLGKNGRNVSDAINAMTRVPADRFYISEERAIAVLRKLSERELRNLREGETRIDSLVKNPRKRAMLKEILSRVNCEMKRAESPIFLEDLIFGVIEKPAPAFYLSRASIRTILYGYLAN